MITVNHTKPSYPETDDRGIIKKWPIHDGAFSLDQQSGWPENEKKSIKYCACPLFADL